MKLSKKEIVTKLINSFDNFNFSPIEATAYNYLIEYEEIGFYESYEAERLLNLCIDILKAAKK